MSIDILKLYNQGRAKAPHQLWTPEEWDAVLLLQGLGLARTTAADYVRNGITTVEDYEKAQKKGFEPVKLDDAVKAAVDGLKDLGNAVKGKGSKKTK